MAAHCWIIRGACKGQISCDVQGLGKNGQLSWINCFEGYTGDIICNVPYCIIHISTHYSMIYWNLQRDKKWSCLVKKTVRFQVGTHVENQFLDKEVSIMIISVNIRVILLCFLPMNADLLSWMSYRGFSVVYYNIIILLRFVAKSPPCLYLHCYNCSIHICRYATNYMILEKQWTALVIKASSSLYLNSLHYEGQYFKWTSRGHVGEIVLSEPEQDLWNFTHRTLSEFFFFFFPSLENLKPTQS